MARYYRRRFSRANYSSHAARHMEARRALSATFGGIDQDVEKAFLDLPSYQLEALFQRYGKLAGAQPEAYARQTFHKWKHGTVKMSGVVAERLLNLVPPFLDADTRFELVKKLRRAHLKRTSRYVTTTPQSWRSAVVPVVREVVSSSEAFQLPDNVTARVRWLADDDAAAAQRLLAAAEREDAAIRLQYIESEFRRIEQMVSLIANTRSVVHTINLPQGDITVTIALPRKSFWRTLLGLN